MSHGKYWAAADNVRLEFDPIKDELHVGGKHFINIFGREAMNDLFNKRPSMTRSEKITYLEKRLKELKKPKPGDIYKSTTGDLILVGIGQDAWNLTQKHSCSLCGTEFNGEILGTFEEVYGS